MSKFTFLSSYIFQLAVISALIYATGDFLDITLNHYVLFGFWVTFNPSIAQSIQLSSKRILGILTGGFFTFFLMIAFQQNSLSVTLAVFLAILFCYFLNLPQIVSACLASITMVSIGHYSDGLNQYYWERFLYNSIGVILGCIMTFLLPPPSSCLQLEKATKKLLISIQSLYEKIINKSMNNDEEKYFSEIEKMNTIITKQIAGNETLFSLAKIELSQGFGSNDELENIKQQQNLIRQIAFSLREMSEDEIINHHEHKLYQKLSLEISNLTQATSEILSVLSDISWQKNIDINNYLLPDLTIALNTLAQKINNLRETGETHNYSLNEIIKISAFLDNLKAISNQVNSLLKLRLN
jgi:hypothetical protein